MFRAFTISLLLLAAVPAHAENNLINIDSLFDPGEDLSTILGGTPGTTTANPEFANINTVASTTNFGGPNASGLPTFDALSTQTVAGDPLLRETLHNFLNCMSQYGSPGLFAPGTGGGGEDDPFGFGEPAQTAPSITDTSNPTVRFCIETAKTLTKERLIHQAQSTLAAIEARQREEQQRDMQMVMAFLAREGGDSEILKILPLLLGSGEGGAGLDPTALLLGGGF